MVNFPQQVCSLLVTTGEKALAVGTRIAFRNGQAAKLELAACLSELTVEYAEVIL